MTDDRSNLTEGDKFWEIVEGLEAITSVEALNDAGKGRVVRVDGTAFIKNMDDVWESDVDGLIYTSESLWALAQQYDVPPLLEI